MLQSDIDKLQDELEAMTDREVARFKNSLEVDDPRLDIVLGEMERRDIDD